MKDNTVFIDSSLSELLGERYGNYAKYIIQDRALPDGRDGLKPVQRRILYAMNELRLWHKTPFKKAARVVGEVIGKYHPHGDSSIYDAMVRMSQDWKFLFPLVEIHGNNGSIDGDNPAAMRYTEARLTEVGESMLRDISKGTVKFIWNFDDSEKEPTVLPALIPNLLINGATGIAAGYATNIPPHNLGEVINATKYRIQNSDCNLSSILKIIKGPDLPTGGIIQNHKEIKTAYKTGKGKIPVMSKILTVQEKHNKKIIVEEIPYEVNKADLIKALEELLFSKPELRIKEVTDATDRFQLRIIIDLHNDANVENTLAFLINKTKLRVNYNINIVAIIDRQPVETGIMGLIDCFINHARTVILNKSKFEINVSQNKLHIIKGLILAVTDLDKVIKIIRNSKNRTESVQNILKQLNLTEKQAEAIVDLKLYRLSSTNIDELNESKKQLSNFIKTLNERVNNPEKLDSYLIGELEINRDKFRTQRRTKIEKEIQIFEVDEQEMIIDEDVVVTVTKNGFLKKIPEKNFDVSKYNDFTCASGDILLTHFKTNSLSQILFVTRTGKYFAIPVNDIAYSFWKRKGIHISNYARVNDLEKIVSCVNLSKGFDTKSELIVASKLGYIKKVSIFSLKISRLNKPTTILKLKPDDEVMGVDIAGSKFVFCLTRNGFISKYGVGEVSILSPKASGSKAISLKNDFVVGMCTAKPDDNLIVVSNNGGLKRVRVGDIPVSKKTNKGTPVVRTIKSNPISFLSLTTKENSDWTRLLSVSGDSLVINNSRVIISDLAKRPQFFYEEKNIVDATHDYCIRPVYDTASSALKLTKEEKKQLELFSDEKTIKINDINSSNQKGKTIMKKNKKFEAMSDDEQELELEKTLSNLDLTLDNLEVTTKKVKEDIEKTGEFQVSLDDMFEEN